MLDLSSTPSKERKDSTGAEGKKKKIFASVTKPERIGEGMNAYVQYTIKSKNETGGDLERVRRYSDFDWLHDILRQEFPSTMIPPLPEKAFINRFSPEFLELRRKGLDRFMARVVNHPLLQKSPDVQIFISGNEQEIQVARQRAIPTAQVKKEPEEKKGFFASLSNTISSVGSNLSTTVSGVEFHEIDPWFDSHKDYINNLDQNLQVMQARSNANSKKKQEFTISITDFGHASSLLSACEVGQDDVLAESWSKLTEASNQMATIHSELAQSESDTFEDSVKDYILLVRSAKEVLENRTNALQKLQNLEADVKVKQDRLAKNTSSSKAASLQTELQQAQDAEAEQKKTFLLRPVFFEFCENFFPQSHKSELSIHILSHQLAHSLTKIFSLFGSKIFEFLPHVLRQSLEMFFLFCLSILCLLQFSLQ